MLGGMMAKNTGGLQIDQDLEFQRREWIAQHVGWWALVAFIAAALLGAFGGGLLSSARAGDEGSALWIDYERFVRVGTTSRLSVHLGAARDGSSQELRINREYFENLRVEQIVPEPDRTVIGGSDVTMYFPPSNDSSVVILDVQPLRIGRQSARFSTKGAQTPAFTQFAYF
jgi:hypothetical protein